MKKNLKWLMSLMLLSGFLAACSDGGETPEQPADPGVPGEEAPSEGTEIPGGEAPSDGSGTDMGE